MSRWPAQRWERKAGTPRREQVRVRWAPVPEGLALLQHMEIDEHGHSNEDEVHEPHDRISIAVSTEEERSATRVCHLYLTVLHLTQVSVLLSGLLVVVLTLWWLVFI